ncbi:MAG TPA: AI-2E family transporter [Bryobacteraceae bacterium]|nr:AI-2E family transporter [Bryobacteraceae bacterium]
MLLLALAIAAMYFAREILIPLALAVMLSLMLIPAATFLERKLHFRRVAAVFAVLAVGIAGLFGAGWIIANQMVEVADRLPGWQQNIHAKIQAIRAPGPLGRAAESVKQIGQELTEPPPAVSPAGHPVKTQAPAERKPVPVQVVETPESGLNYVRDLLKPIVAPLAQALIVLVFTAFLLIEREDVRNRLLRVAGLSQISVMTVALDDVAQRVEHYLMLLLAVNTTYAFLFALGLYLIGVPYAVLWGALAGVLRIVPYVGTLVAALLPLVLSMAVFNGWMHPLMVFVLFGVLEGLTGNVIEPWLYGSHCGISSLALLVTAIFWAVLWGPAGLVLSTPLTVCLVTLGRYVPQLSFLHILLGDEPVLTESAQVYQRLLAMDSSEARSIVDTVLKDKPKVELFDTVLLPALGLAEQDRHKGQLDTVREQFLFLSMKEMLGEFAETPHEISESRTRVICLPASDEADEIAAAMLAQTLGAAGYAAIAFPAGVKVSELGGLLEEGRDIVCVSSVPPFAFAHASAMCRRLRARFHDITLVAGIWGFSGDPEQALGRFDQARPDRLVTTLAQAVEFVGESCAAEPERV